MSVRPHILTTVIFFGPSAIPSIDISSLWLDPFSLWLYKSCLQLSLELMMITFPSLYHFLFSLVLIVALLFCFVLLPFQPQTLLQVSKSTSHIQAHEVLYWFIFLENYPHFLPDHLPLVPGTQLASPSCDGLPISCIPGFTFGVFPLVDSRERVYGKYIIWDLDCCFFSLEVCRIFLFVSSVLKFHDNGPLC